MAVGVEDDTGTDGRAGVDYDGDFVVGWTGEERRV
jgi:hypothetical protein